MLDDRAVPCFIPFTNSLLPEVSRQSLQDEVKDLRIIPKEILRCAQGGIAVLRIKHISLKSNTNSFTPVYTVFVVSCFSLL